MKPINEQVNLLQECIWKRFMQWLSAQNVNTIKNFTGQKWQWMIIKERKYLKLNEEEEVEIYYLNE